MMIKTGTLTISKDGTSLAKDGKNVGKDSYEAVRVYYKFKPEFGNGTVDESSLSGEKKMQYQLFTKAKKPN